MIYGIETLIEYFEDMDIDEKGSDKGDNSHHDAPSKGETKRMKTYPVGIRLTLAFNPHWNMFYLIHAGLEPGVMYQEMVSLSNKSVDVESTESSGKVLFAYGDSSNEHSSSSQWEESAVDSALLAISAPQHKQHIHSHLHVQ